MATDPQLFQYVQAGVAWRVAQPSEVVATEFLWMGEWVEVRWTCRDGQQQTVRVPLTLPTAAPSLDPEPRRRKTPAPGRGRSPKCAAAILRTLEEKLKWMTAEELEAADIGYSLTTVTHEAAALVKDGKLKKHPRGKGYGLLTWPED